MIKNDVTLAAHSTGSPDGSTPASEVSLRTRSLPSRVACAQQSESCNGAPRPDQSRTGAPHDVLKLGLPHRRHQVCTRHSRRGHVSNESIKTTVDGMRFASIEPVTAWRVARSARQPLPHGRRAPVAQPCAVATCGLSRVWPGEESRRWRRTGAPRLPAAARKG